MHVSCDRPLSGARRVRSREGGWVLNCFYSSVSFEGSPWGQLAIKSSEPKSASRLKHRYDARTQQDPSLSPTCTRAAPLTQRKLVPSLASTLTPQLTTDTTSPLIRIHAHYPKQAGGYIYHSPPPSSHMRAHRMLRTELASRSR